ncbi:MAG TPA: beta-eliminating lyase-related protein [Segeticoccus sp.]|uniref:threonine aldolase family protein n=1 Tax=Segeticoccus sp. TaxID=2706531 RepID=UPI002D80C02D|nr:beta-eliminating lyase-related protein [Segeticoccus sp.]HET8602161.1 beta-eliminating lyase-related protein [Segeticoccus sp.]
MTPQRRYELASDNCACALPEVMDALAAANAGTEPSYGEDSWTARLQEVVRSHFGPTAEAFPVFNGTGANVVALQAMQPPWGSVVCARTAHINVDECGAPERFGMKLVPVDTPDGKLTPELIAPVAQGFGDEHHAQPSVVSLTQSSELGTVYTVEEISAICDYAHGLGMTVHLDGARLANAAAALDLPLRALTTDAGVDVLSFGGTKNGMLYGEAVVVLNPDAARGMLYIRKFSMQLASKMRYISAQLIALLEGDLWRQSAARANERAALLRSLVEAVPGVRPTQPTQANAVFVVVPPDALEELTRLARFEVWDAQRGEVRWMCAHDTSEADVRAFADELHRLMSVAVG